MKRKTVLYISTNDGSDMRINKEIRSLSKNSDVLFFGVGDYSNCYVARHCREVVLIRGKRNTVSTLFKQVANFIKYLFTRNIDTIHIINEQLYIFFYPFLFFRHTVLDLFDSIFLKKNMGGEKIKWLKWIIYLPADKILLTDENRFDLMPSIIRSKCLVLPNYPESFCSGLRKVGSDHLRILYNGWMGKNRGTEIIEGLLTTNKPLRIYMAGWFIDEYTHGLLDKYKEDIEWLGVIEQRLVLELTAKEIDYIMCTYAPINDNYKNASPNKIYDAIQCMTPVIMNREVKISEWVKGNEFGYILPSYYIEDYDNLFDKLISAKDSFSFNEEVKKKYVWENVESILLSAHLFKV